MKKRVLSLTLVLAMALAMSVPAFATEEMKMRLVQAEIEQGVAASMARVADQLEGIDPRYVEAYEAMVAARVERQVLAEYGLAPQSTQTFRLPNGGTVAYEWTNPGGDEYAIGVVLLDKHDTDIYLSEKEDAYNAAEILEGILGFVPAFGTAFSLVFNYTSWVRQSDLDRIERADGYAQITNVRFTYEPEADTVSILDGWVDHPYYTTHDGAQNVAVEYF